MDQSGISFASSSNGMDGALRIAFISSDSLLSPMLKDTAKRGNLPSLQTIFSGDKLQRKRSLSPISPPPGNQHGAKDRGTHQQAKQAQLARRIRQMLVTRQAVHR